MLSSSTCATYYCLLSHHSLFFFYHSSHYSFFFFFFNDTATTEIYTLSLHDALPISLSIYRSGALCLCPISSRAHSGNELWIDRKSTRLNSSHPSISYAVFCLKKKKKKK